MLVDSHNHTKNMADLECNVYVHCLMTFLFFLQYHGHKEYWKIKETNVLNLKQKSVCLRFNTRSKIHLFNFLWLKCYFSTSRFNFILYLIQQSIKHSFQWSRCRILIAAKTLPSHFVNLIKFGFKSKVWVKN